MPIGRLARSPGALGLRLALASAVIALLCVCARLPAKIPGTGVAAEAAFVPSMPASPAAPAAHIALFDLSTGGPEPVHAAAHVDARTGLREDTLSRGDVAAIEAPALRVTLTRGTISGVEPTLFVLMARRAANGPALDRPALSIVRTGSRGQIRTKLGAVETLEVTFGGQTPRTCLGFVTRDAPYRLDGWLCAPLGHPPEAQTLGCMLDGLRLVDLADPDTTAAFADPPSQANACPSSTGRVETSGRTGSVIPRSRNKK